MVCFISPGTVHFIIVPLAAFLNDKSSVAHENVTIFKLSTDVLATVRAPDMPIMSYPRGAVVLQTTFRGSSTGVVNKPSGICLNGSENGKVS